MAGTFKAINPATVPGGPNIRTLELELVQSDGTTATVEVQIVALADETGAVLKVNDLLDRLDAIAHENRRISRALALLVGELCGIKNRENVEEMLDGEESDDEDPRRR